MCPDCQSLKFYGKVRKAEKKWLDEVFVQNPGLNEVYPGDTRYILDAFLIYEGYGEWFDLLSYPINRELFSYGVEAEQYGFRITETCIGCGKCAKSCPQNINIPQAMKDFAAAIEKMPSWAEVCKQREEAALKARAK